MFLIFRHEPLIGSVQKECMHVRTCLLLLVMLISVLVPVYGETTIIPPGGEVFLGEEGLDISQAVPYPYDAIAFFPPGSSPSSETPSDIIRVDGRRFSILPVLFAGLTGTWYQWDSRLQRPGSVAFIVRVPRIQVKVINRETMKDVSGGVATRGSPLLIAVESNLEPVSRRPGYDPVRDGVYDLLVTTPAGGTLTSIQTPYHGSYSLLRLTPAGNPDYIPPLSSGGWDTDPVSQGRSDYTGVYRISPRVTLNRIDSNLAGTPYTDDIRGTSLTFGSDTLSLTARSAVTRGNPFTVEITGSPGMQYHLWVESSSRSGEYGDQAPMILFAQSGVTQDLPEGPYVIGSYPVESESGKPLKQLVSDEPYHGVKYYAAVVPDSDGRRVVELRTSSATRDGTYTINLEGRSGSGRVIHDSTEIRVTKGEISLNTGRDSYPMGEEILLSGRNSGSCETYLFMTGPNLPSSGSRLEAPDREVRNMDPGSFTMADGDCETWEYRFRTGNLGIDAGTYTIYAVSAPVDRNHLSGNPYETLSLTLRRPVFAVENGPSVIAAGDPLYITGVSAGAYNGVAIWIFGHNRMIYDTVPVDSGGFFEYELRESQTESLVPGQYLVVIQHPMGNGEFDIWPDGRRELVLGSYPYPGAPQFRISGPGALDSSSAASALINALKSPFIDDTYSTREITIRSPKIVLDDASAEYFLYEPVYVTGTTNLAVGDRLLIEITDNQFIPTIKGSDRGSDGFSGTAEVMPGPREDRIFSLTIPPGRLDIGEYRVFVQAVSSRASDSGLLAILPVPPAGDVVNITTTTEPQAVLTPVEEVTIYVSVQESPITPAVTPTIAEPLPEVSPKEKPALPRLPADHSPLLYLGVGALAGLLLSGFILLIARTRSGRMQKQEDETRSPAPEEAAEPIPEDDSSGEDEENEEE